MVKRFALLLILLSAIAGAAETARQPVLIVLYSRFFDHGHQFINDERIQRLMKILDKLHGQYPQTPVPVLFQFSGSVTQVLAEQNSGAHLVDKIKDYSGRGLVQIGYTGEDEPSYLYRPKPDLLTAETVEQRWAATYDAGWRFLNDFKNPITGMPVPGLTGGLRKTIDTLGSADLVTGITTRIGGEAAFIHALRKMDPNAIVSGIRPSDRRFGIESYGNNAAAFSRLVSPDPQESPEIFWDDNILRISDVSLGDHKPHTTDETMADLKTAFNRLERDHVRVIKLEVGSFLHYQTRRADGSVIDNPMEWLYYHPDEPVFPPTMKPFVSAVEVEAGYERDEAVLQWLLREFLPANPGSRFVSLKELARMGAPTAAPVTAGEVKQMAADIDKQFIQAPMIVPDFARAGNRFFSLAEAYGVLTQAVAGIEKTNAIPGTVAQIPVYGPLEIPEESMGISSAAIKESDVMKTAAQLAPRFAREDWSVVPRNAVPLNVEAGGIKLNAAQFLRLMAQVCLDPKPEKLLYVNGVIMYSNLSLTYPKNSPLVYNGDSWTLKPAPLMMAAPAGGARAAAER